MKNDTIRVQSNTFEYTTRSSGRGQERMDGSFIRPQESSTDETYSDGYIDYVHEI